MSQKPSFRNRFAQFLKNSLVAEIPLYDDPYRSTVLKGVALKPYAQISEAEKEIHKAIVECTLTSQHPKDSPEFLKELMDKLVAPFKFDNRDNHDLHVLLAMANRAATEQDYTPWSFDTEDLISIAKEIEKKRLWSTTAEEYWRIAKEDFAIQRGEQESISPDALATMTEITNTIISLRGKHSGIPKSFMFTEKKPYHKERHYIVSSHQIVNREGEGLTPVGYRALIRAKRDFDASIDSGEIYQVFMRLFCYLTMKERHLLYPVLCKQGPVVGIDDSTLSNISEVISNDDFCLKYKEIYDIFYNVK